MEYKLDFIRVLAEEKNVTRAAERLFITQPTLTKYINRIEAELGVVLFDRRHQPIQLTHAGQVFLEEMTTIQAREAAMFSKIQSMSTQFDTFTIGIQMVRSYFILPRTMPQFTEKYPEVLISADTVFNEGGSLERAILRGELDVGIGAFALAFDKLKYHCLQRDEIMFVMPREWFPHVKADEGDIDHPLEMNADMLQNRRLLLPRQGGGQFMATQSLLDETGVEPKYTFRGNNVITNYKLVSQGIGYMVTTPLEFTAAFPEETEKLCFGVVPGRPMTQNTYFAYPKEKEGNPMIQDFLNLIYETDPFHRGEGLKEEEK